MNTPDTPVVVVLGYSPTLQPPFAPTSPRPPPEHTHAHTRTHTNARAQVCVEELDVPPSTFLETILIFLLPSSKSESAIAYQVVSVLLKRCMNKLSQPIGTYVNSMFAGRHQESELKVSGWGACCYDSLRLPIAC